MTNQDIIEMAYAHSELIAPLIERHIKLCFEQANCYMARFVSIGRLLTVIDPKYLEQHSRIWGFYQRSLECHSDRLYWAEEGAE